MYREPQKAVGGTVLQGAPPGGLALAFACRFPYVATNKLDNYLP